MPQTAPCKRLRPDCAYHFARPKFTFVEVTDMRPRTALASAAYLLMACIAVTLAAQGAPPQTPPPAAPAGAPQAPAGQPPGPGQGRGRGLGTFPAQQRPPGDPEVIKKGSGLYGVYCRACHGTDLRGGDQGGPNLLRSQVVLNDQNGELILPVVQNGRQNPGMPVMPPLNIPEEDVRAIATYIHSVTASARGQGAPPAGPPVELNIVVGDAKAGEAYFASKCSACHKAADMQGIATRVGEPMALQNHWVTGGGRSGRNGGPPTPVTVVVTDATGQKFEGRLVRIDDFIVVLSQADGMSRSFRRDGGVPKVEIRDPRQAHLKLLPTYSDKDIHDVTAYLVTLK
jgi:cytochrome c oxidase cbb3-type subunit 3